MSRVSQFSVVFLLKLVLVVISVNSQKDVGKTCQLQETQANGTCTRADVCEYAQNLIKNGRQPTACGFKKSTAIVCCPNSEEMFNLRRISAQKCEEYSRSVYKTISFFSGTVRKKTVDTCSNNYTPLVIGGDNANAGEFPHMALIGHGRPNVLWNCGGSLISERHVLTAAHCGNAPGGEASYVRLGKLNRGVNGLPSESDDIAISRFIVHPSYEDGIFYNDIAIVELSSSVAFSRTIRPACLPYREGGPEISFIATGWGNLAFLAPNAEILQKVALEKLPNERCRTAHSASEILPRGIDTANMICAGSLTDVKDTCQGDSGGPLQIFHHYRYCMYEVSGVTSFGGLCGEKDKPGVYVKVYSYLDWIESTVWG